LFKNPDFFSNEGYQADMTYLRADAILSFYDDGGSVMILADVDASKTFRNVLNNFGYDLHEPVRQEIQG
jgi:hypothetical protein